MIPHLPAAAGGEGAARCRTFRRLEVGEGGASDGHGQGLRRSKWQICRLLCSVSAALHVRDLPRHHGPLAFGEVPGTLGVWGSASDGTGGGVPSCRRYVTKGTPGWRRREAKVCHDVTPLGGGWR